MNLKNIVTNTMSSVLILSIAAVIGCTTIRPSYEVSKQKCESKWAISPGNLYFYEHSKSRLNLMKILDRVQNNFCKVGIKFRESAIFRNGKFPSLKNTDILMLMDEDYQDKKFIGRFGLELKEYFSMKPRIGFDYNIKTSENNLGFIDPKTALKSAEKKTSKSLSDSEKLRLISQLFTHEVAHGFGASHIQPEYSGAGVPKYYFMDPQTFNNTQTFFPRNIFRMKSFINKTNAKEMNKAEMIKLRYYYIYKEDLTENQKLN